MLEIKNIKKTYTTQSFKQVALKDVSISFRKSEFVSILGPSGSGKTTLLNIIGGLDKYDDGDLIIDGVSTKDYNDRLWDLYRNNKIGFVFQNYNLITHQSIVKNVELSLTLTGLSQNSARSKALKALEDVGLLDHAYKKPNELSGGQMQRVAIARALVNNPDIILADEPTGALDSKTSKQIMDLLKKVSEDRLVIMVTHNEDLANEYSTRIIKLKDGEIISDSMKYDCDIKRKESSKQKKLNLSLKTSLKLSLNNLMTKKGRTILTAFAGSIGIIGIALILSLSTGIHNYIEKTEKETLSSYPLMIEKQSIDIASMMGSFVSDNENKEYDNNKIYSTNIMGDLFENMTRDVKTNDLESFKKYLDNHKDIHKYVTDIKYGYNTGLVLYNKDYLRVNPTTTLSSIGLSTEGVSNTYSSYLSNYDVFFELIDNDDLLNKQYTIIEGKFPKEYNELILIVGEENTISDYTLYSLGLLDQNKLKDEFMNMTMGKEVNFEEKVYNKDELINLEYKILLDSEGYIKEDGIYKSRRDDINYIKSILDKKDPIKIVGIAKINEDAVGNVKNYGIVGYTSKLTEYISNENNKTNIVKEQIKNKDINVFTGEKFNLDSEYDYNLRALGVSDLSNPSSISIYPKDFESKDEIVKIINDYNKDNDEITYTDFVGVMMSSVTKVIDVITSILIAFVAISLIVSSIMIAIITYISVLERTKEIGILRAIGASKKDIAKVFNSEGIIIGTISGILGILVTIILNIPINIIVKEITGVSKIASLPISGAIILIVISILLTLISSLAPAKVASKKDPVEALRSE